MRPTLIDSSLLGRGSYLGLKIPDDRVKYPFLAMHNIILTHASAVKHYKENYQATQKGEIGVSLVTEWFEPDDGSRSNRAASERTFDFLTEYSCMSHQSSILVRTFTAEKNRKPIRVQSPGKKEIYVYPQGLGDAPEYINREYGQPKIYITENAILNSSPAGYPEKRDDSIPMETALKDDARIQHIIAHLQSVSTAIK
ncbi:hypothetical protein ACH5RR_010965 [Cinchona calisaya]|uniref:Uncharacterized protein n=1 Tax=Cinchona calisaya TaxID=153742 RepID=A0ABD3A501_9GENT